MQNDQSNNILNTCDESGSTGVVEQCGLCPSGYSSDSYGYGCYPYLMWTQDEYSYHHYYAVDRNGNLFSNVEDTQPYSVRCVRDVE